MIAIEKLHEDHIAFAYESLDRVILNGYIPTLQTEGAVAYFFREVCHKPIVSPVLFKQMTDRFVAAIQSFAQSHAIPVLHVGQGQKPGDLGQPALARAEREGRWGVVAIVVHQESARAFSSYHWAGHKKSAFTVKRATRVVNHYYFYLRDRDFGAAFIRICSYLPFPLRVWVNAHDWIAARLRAAGIPFRMDENCFLDVASEHVPQLQHWADAFGQAALEQFLARWVPRLPQPLTAAERAAGYAYHFSIYQLELCHNLIFKDTRVLNRLYEQLLRDHLEFGRPEYLKLFFGRQIRKTSPVQPRTRLLRDGAVSCLKIFYKHSFLKQYNKVGRLLRTEVCVNNPRDFGVNKGLAHLAYLRRLAHYATQRFLKAQAVSYHTALDRSSLERIVAPSVTADGKPCPGLALGRPRAMATLEGLCAVGLLFPAFSNATFRQEVARLRDEASDAYGAPQAGYDLKKLRGKGLITKLPGKNLYAVTEQGHRVSQFITKLHHRVLVPGLAYAQGAPAPAEMAHSSDALDRANLRVWRAIDDLITAAGLVPAVN
jgi:hypothetical protein